MKFKKLLILCLTAVFCFGFFACNEEPPISQPTLGVWWWKDSLGDEYLNFAKNNGVTEIYFCSGKFNNTTTEFIKKAKKKNMKVYWLAGEYEWVEHNNWLFTQMDRYINFQQTSSYKFDGIHFDIEPHQHSEWEPRRTELITKFVELVYTIKTNYPNIYVNYDLPYWLEDEVVLNGVTKPAFQHVLDNANKITLMSYRDKAEKIYEVSSAEIEYAQEIGKPINLGVNTYSTEGDHVSFQEEGKKVMYEQIALLRQMLPDNYGVVIHQMERWYNLKD